MSGNTRANNHAGRGRPRARRLVVIGAVCTAVLTGLAQGAQASTAPQVATLGWQVMNVPNPSGSISGSLTDVSCSSPTACMAVGSYESAGSVFTTYGDAWNGSTWTLNTMPAGSSSDMNGVACLSATDCEAVGDVLTGVGINTDIEAEVWNGSSWTIQATPTPAKATRAFLVDVSCTSASQCQAVGFYSKTGSHHQFLLAEDWNGSTWSIENTPAPTGAIVSQFNGVSCSSATSCIAVGTNTNPTDNMLSERWNGTSWKVLSTPNPAGGSDSALLGVSCTSATSCTDSGDYYNGSADVSLAEHWDGTAWTQQTTQNRPGAIDTDLAGVSCATASRCEAVGGNYRNKMTRTMAEDWNGSAWSIKHVGAPSGSVESALVSVSCSSTSHCIAVGFWVNNVGTDFSMAAQYAPGA